MLTGRPKPGVTDEQVAHALRDMDGMRYVAGQHEVSANGEHHYQVYLQCSRTVRASHISKATRAVWRSCHFILQSKNGGTAQDCKEYCTKEDTRHDGSKPFEFGDMCNGRGQRSDRVAAVNAILDGAAPVEVVRDNPNLLHLWSSIQGFYRSASVRRARDLAAGRTIQPLRWQQQAMSVLSAQGDRQVLWIVDRRGGSGKSVLMGILQGRAGQCCQLGAGRSGDLVHAWRSAGMPTTLLFDLARARSEFLSNIMELIENFKSGFVFAPKFDSATIPCSGIKVIVVSNDIPPTRDDGKLMWTADRYDVRTLAKGHFTLGDDPTLYELPEGEPWTKEEREELSLIKFKGTLTREPKAAAPGNWR
jgi:hypothetical protein